MDIGHVQIGGVGVLAAPGAGGEGAGPSTRLKGVQILTDLAPHQGQQRELPLGDVLAAETGIFPGYGFIGAQASANEYK